MAATSTKRCYIPAGGHGKLDVQYFFSQNFKTFPLQTQPVQLFLVPGRE